MKKQDALNVINNLPNHFSVDVLIEQLIIISKIDKGLQDIKEGKTLSTIKVRSEVKKWSK
jgi:hypothetical protein